MSVAEIKAKFQKVLLQDNKHSVHSVRSVKKIEHILNKLETSSKLAKNFVQQISVSQDLSCGCPTIPFSLGNGLPFGATGAVPNSDGSYGTFVISSPGNYVLQNSTQQQISGNTNPFNPTATIAITSSDVHLDLCGQVLTGSGNLTAPFSPAPSPSDGNGIINDTRVDSTFGININPNFFPPLDNISVKNGKLQYYSLSAIQHLNVNNLILEDLLIEHSGSITVPTLPSAIFGLLGNNVVYNNLGFLSNIFGDAFTISVNNLVFSNCISRGCRGGSLNTLGPNNIFLADRAYVDFGQEAIPITVDTSDGLIIDNFLISDVQALADCFGIFANRGCKGVVIKNCDVTDVFTPSDQTDLTRFQDAFTYGFEMRGIAAESGCQGVLIENCTVQNVGSPVQFIGPVTRDVAGNSVTGYNIQNSSGVIMRNCSAANIFSAGRITSTQPFSNIRAGNTSDYPAAGFTLQFAPGVNDNELVNCSASNVNGGQGVSQELASPGMGYFFQQGDTQAPSRILFQNCKSFNCIGNNQSAGFSNLLVEPVPLIFDNCIAQFDRIHNPNGLSNGFYTSSGNLTGGDDASTPSSNNLVFRNCIASGHTLDGFNLSGLPVDVPESEGYSKFILDNCISNANSGYGFNLQNTVKQAEVINSKATNNGKDGVIVSGRDVVIRNTVADLNGNNGFNFEAYFPFTVKVATDTDLSNLPIYLAGNPPGYTVQLNNGVLQLVPNDLSQPIPSTLPINGVNVQNGDLVLVKDETNPVLNGVYQVNNNGAVSNGTGVTQIWQLIRWPTWTSGNTVPAGTKVLVELSNSPNLSPGPVMYVLQNNVQVDVNSPVFTATKHIKADKSRILLEDSKASLNGKAGVVNTARKVVIENVTAKMNKCKGFVDNTLGGAQKSQNIYLKNEAVNNGRGTTRDNYDVDYVNEDNYTVLKVGTLWPAVYPDTHGQANIAINLKGEKNCKERCRK